MEDLRKIIGNNLSELRKKRGLTQLELAEKFNYTDRAVSKWENGDTLPDVEILYNLCEFYGVTLDYLTHENNNFYVKRNNELQLWNKIAITCLVSMIVWGLATIIFVFSLLRRHTALWQSFVVAVPITSIIVLYFNMEFNCISLFNHIGSSILAFIPFRNSCTSININLFLI